MDSSMPGFPVLHHLPEFAQTHVPWISDAIQSSHPRLPPSPLALSPSQHTSLFNESAFHITWQKYWSFIFSTSPSNSGLISFYIYWFDLLDFLDVRGILKSLLQHHSLKTAVFQSSVSSLTCIHDYWKNYRFDYMDFVGKVMSLLFNTLSRLLLLPGESHGRRSLVGYSPWGLEESDTTEQLHFHFSLSCIGEGNGNPLQCSCLENPRDGGAWWAAVYGVTQSQTWLKWLSSSSRFVTAFLPRNRCLLISWLQSLSAVILEPKKFGDYSCPNSRDVILAERIQKWNYALNRASN